MRLRNQSGAVAVEFALVLPVLAMLLLGTITGGLAFNDHLALTNAVREGARFGATTVNNGAWNAAVVTRTQQVYLNGMSTLSTSQVCAQLWQQTAAVSPVLKQGPATCNLGTTPPDVPDGVLAGECYVMVWAAKPANLDYVLGSADITLGAGSVSYYERTPCVPPVVTP